jgi:hypothetical protein
VDANERRGEPPAGPLWELQVGTVLPVWVLSALAALLIGFLSGPGQYPTWAAIALAAAVLVTFCIQLATLTKEGFVLRTMASIGGSLAILALATAVLAVLGR